MLVFVVHGTNIALGGRIARNGGNCVDTSGWQLILAAILLSVGATVIFICYCAVSNEGDVLDDENVQRTRAAVGIVSLGYQVIYLLIVLIAAIGHPERLLWILPEIPFETIMIVCLLCKGGVTTDK